MVSIHTRKGSSEPTAMETEEFDQYTPNIVKISLEELQKKADAADDMYESCVSCGRRCEDNRQAGKLGKCVTGESWWYVLGFCCN